MGRLPTSGPILRSVAAVERLSALRQYRYPRGETGADAETDGLGGVDRSRHRVYCRAQGQPSAVVSDGRNSASAAGLNAWRALLAHVRLGGG